MRATFVVLAFLVPGLAGCLTADVPDGAAGAGPFELRLSQPTLEGVLVEQVRVASYDGVEIDNWVFRPDTDEAVPVLLNFSPYWGNAAPPAETGGDAYSLHLIDHYVPRGYAVVLSSARGTGDSDGCFTIGGPGELADMVAVADHFAAADWSNGRLAAGAKSYDGTMPQGLAVTGHPALRAIFPTSPISEFYKYNYVNGVPYAGTGTAFNTYYVLGVGWGVYDPERIDPMRTKDDVVCPDNVDVQRAQYESLATGDYTPYWQARNYTARASGIRPDLGVFYVHGLQDWNVKPDHMWPWFDDLEKVAGDGKGVYVRKLLGQWGHDYSHRPDSNLTFLRFFDHFLKDIDTGLLSEPAVEVQASDGTWRREVDWPPKRAVPVTFYPDQAGTLGREPGTGEVRTVDGGLRPPTGEQWTFLTEPLAEDLHYAGLPHVRLRVSHTAAHGTLAVTLYDVDGDTWTPINQGFLDLRHRGSLERSEPVRPGETMDVSFAMYPQDDVVAKGHRLALAFANTSPLGARVTVTPHPSGGMTTWHLDGASLTLPVLPHDPSLVEDPQPADVGCWAC